MFPLGGIGTGSIGLAGNGELIDWEIFNRPNKNTRNGYSHFAIRARVGDQTYVKVLQGDTHENLSGSYDGSMFHRGFGFGVSINSMAGLPHFHNHRFEGNFPLANLELTDEDFPGNVYLTAFNPMIPHDSYNSSLPAALFEWEIKNTTDEIMEIALAFSVCNPSDASENRAVQGVKEGHGLWLVDAQNSPKEIGYKDLCILTDASEYAVQEYWYRGGWQDARTMFWNNFFESERMPKRCYEEPAPQDHGSVVSYIKIAPQCKGKIRFVLAWNVPNQYNYWRPYKDENGKDIIWKNYYATQFENSCQTAEYVLQRFSKLKEQSELFARAMRESTLPEVVYDAVSANLSVLKTATVLRLEDGSLWGWEGCNERIGSCEGSCQHVWNYAYALPYLFPDLERSLRENTIKYALKKTGATTFRVPLPLGRKLDDFRPCVDGQMGEVFKCYREWKLSGDNEWLQDVAPAVFKMLEYAYSPENPDCWDADEDGVLEGRQHHTLDMELFGPNSWLQGFYLLALDCGARIAEEVQEQERAAKYRTLYENGRQWMNENLFNGKYFCQKIDLSDKEIITRFDAEKDYWNDEAKEIKYQVADGCIIDQMLADWHAGMIGLPTVFDNDKKMIALRSLYENNYVPSMRNITNLWRNFAINDEGGTIICSYPNGVKKQAIQIPYCEEVMTGFEYALAGLMLQNGFITEGETMIRAIRDRYDGEKRNPWNEIECGSNYARSMASFALLPIYSGFSFDMTEYFLGFTPLYGGGKYLWSVADSWGTVEINEAGSFLSVFGTPLHLASFGMKDSSKVDCVSIDGNEIPFTVREGKICFKLIAIKDKLEIKKDVYES